MGCELIIFFVAYVPSTFSAIIISWGSFICKVAVLTCGTPFPWLANLLGSGRHLFILATLGRERGFDCMQEVGRMSGIARIGHLSPAREHFPCNSPRLCQTCGREAGRGTAGMQYRARWLLSGWAAAAACMCRGENSGV